MTLDSSSKHHTASMRLLLIALTCLATSLALPQPRQKRDVLPGDPRYGTTHHHPVNVIDTAKSVNGYSYSVPQVPQDTYGPPGYQPGSPLGNEYLSPVVDVIKHSTPVPSYGVPDTVYIPEVAETYLKPEAKKTISVPVETVKTVTTAPPSTSYGIPIVKTVKTTVGTGVNSHVKSTVKTVKTEISEQQDISPSAVKVVEQTPTVQDVTRFTNEVKSIPTVTTTVTKNLLGNSVFAERFPTVYGSYGGVYNVPNYDLHVQQSSGFDSFDTVPNGYNNFGLNYPLTSLNREFNLGVPQPLPLSVHVTKNIPTTYSFPQTVEVPKTTLQVPQSLTHTVQQVQHPLHTLHSLPSVSSVESLSPVQHTVFTDTLTPAQPVHSVQDYASVQSYTPVQSYTSAQSYTPVQTYTPVETVETVPPVQQVHTVESVKSVETPVQHTLHSVEPVQSLKYGETLTPVQHTVHSVQPVQSVKYTETITPVQHTVHSVQSEPSVKSVEDVTPIHHTVHSVQSVPSVKYTETLTPVQHTVHSVQSVPSVKSVETLTPIESLSTVQPVHSVQTVSTVHPVESVETVSAVHPVKSVEILPPLSHPVESHHTVTEVVKTKTVPTVGKHINIQTEKGPISDFFQNLGENLSFPSFPSFPSLPSLPSFPSLPSLPGSPTTVAPPVEVSSPSSIFLADTHNQENINIDNPLLPNGQIIKSTVTPANEYVQPTDANGGYIY